MHTGTYKLLAPSRVAASHSTTIVEACLAIVCLLAVTWCDYLDLHVAPLVPLDSPYHVAFSALLVSAAAVGSGLFIGVVMRLATDRNASGFAADEWWNLGTLVWQAPKTGRPVQKALAVKTVINTGILAGAVLFVLVFLVYPKQFSNLAHEDGPVENLSALFLFSSSFVFVAIARRMRVTPAPWGPIAPYLALLGAIGLFVIGGEEISWGQRIFGLHTPELLADNAQEEMNLHNLATYATQTTYYFGSFLLLVVGPLVAAALPRSRVPQWIRPFLPGTSVLIAGCVATAFHGWYYNQSHTMIAFFGSAITLLMLSLRPPRNFEIPRWLLVAAAIIIVAIRIAFAEKDASLVRSWDPTEYKELFIPIGFFLYSVDVWLRTTRKRAA